ncbi:MAG: ABC transporter ATP-binding protein [bacterium]
MEKKYFSFNWDWLQKRLTLLPVDFSEPWWWLITKQKAYLVVALIGEAITNAFKPLSVLLLSYVFESRRLDYLVYLFLLWGLTYAIEYVARLNNYILQIRAVYSLRFRAHQWFLQVDPIFHMQRSSGTILGKIDRAFRGIEEFIETVFYDLLETSVSVITVVVTLYFYSGVMSIVALTFMSLIFTLNMLLMYYVVLPLERRLIKVDDHARAENVESLSQVNFIRTSFASDQTNERLHEKNTNVMRKDGALSFTFIFFYELIKVFYLVSVFCVGAYILHLVSLGTVSVPVGTALLLMYLRGTYDIVRVERPLKRVVKSMIRIQDLFSYLTEFGKQTYPVFKEEESALHDATVKNHFIKIVANNLFFDYNPNAKIFDNHSLNLVVPQDEKNKLYGIIGPSGVGKSTLMYILGGQFKPASGSVLINGIDIYNVDDVVRRKLIALQGQVATSMRGTLRYNLMFSIPKEKCLEYTDDFLISILERVGLWDLFEAKKGLDTFIGESGFTISGGQRQRLNFANLYLRATCFKPLLILIDEPTSSLDEVSEHAITSMINTLARDAVTMVIAHRLKTIKEAIGIFDFSLLSTDKDITFYDHEVLKQKSIYYRRLIDGSEPIDL